MIDQGSLSPSGKLSVRNVTAKPDILNILSNTRVFAAVEKRMVKSTRIGGDISPRRVPERTVLKTGKGFLYMLYFVIPRYLWLMKGKIHDKSDKYKIFNLTLQAA